MMRKKEELYKQIGKMKVEIDWQKKSYYNSLDLYCLNFIDKVLTINGYIIVDDYDHFFNER